MSSRIFQNVAEQLTQASQNIISVMDIEGNIIASGDTSRIGDRETEGHCGDRRSAGSTGYICRKDLLRAEGLEPLLWLCRPGGRGRRRSGRRLPDVAGLAEFHKGLL